MELNFDIEKTVIIFTDSQLNFKFFVVEGDYSYLNNVKINEYENNDKEDELRKLLFDENNKLRHKFYTQLTEPLVDRNTEIIHCGMIIPFGVDIDY